jgi:glycosyltransferase involved in cell wall biosynthesis
LPVVGTNVRGINDIIKNNYNGILCKESGRQIASAIQRIVEDNKVRSRLRKNSVKSVKKYSFDSVMNQVYGLIKNA